MAHPDTERARGISNRGIPRRKPEPIKSIKLFVPKPGITTTRMRDYRDEEMWVESGEMPVPVCRGEVKLVPRETIQDIVSPPLPTLPPMPDQEGPEEVATPPGRVPSAAKSARRVVRVEGAGGGQQLERFRRRRRLRPKASSPLNPHPSSCPRWDIYMGEAAERRKRERLLRQAFITNPLRVWAALKELAPKEELRRQPPEWELDERDPMDIYRRRMISYKADQIRRDRAITDGSRGTKVPPKKPKVMTRLDIAKMQIKKGFPRGIGKLLQVLPDTDPDTY